MTKSLRILHLEDDLQDAKLVDACLIGGGMDCDILWVDSGEAFLSALDRGGFDVILADYSLPVFDGLSAMRMARERCPETPFILVSGVLGEEEAIECLKLGATDYVLKHHLSRLVACIKRALREADELKARKIAETQMRLQSAALEAAAKAIVITDREGRITWVNPAFDKLTGYSAQEALGQNPRLLKSGVHDQRFYQNLWKTVLSGEVWSGEMINRHKDGTFYTEEQSITPVKDDAGTISHFIAIKQDITKRKIAEERAQAHFNRIRALHEIDLAITSSLELPEVLRVLLEKVSGFFPYPHACSIGMVNHETGAVEPTACRNISAQEWNAEVAGSAADLCGRVVETGVPVVINDLQNDPRTRDVGFFRRNELASFMGAPLIAKEEPLGALAYFTKAKHRFSDGEIEFLVTLAGQAAIAIHNAQLHQETKAQQQKLAEQERVQRILKELSQDITKLDVNTLLEKLTHTMREVFQVDIADARFLGKTRWQKVVIASEAGVEWPPGGGKMGEGATLWVANHRRSLAIRDYTEQKEFAPGRVVKKFGVHGFLAAPMIAKSGDVLGVIRVMSKRPRDFTSQEIDLFEQMARGAAIAIENEQLYTHLKKSDKAKAEFLGLMSHELRTPLNVIMGYAKLIKDDLVSEADAPHRQSLQIIEHNTHSLLRIIDTIMAATKIESGSVAVDRQEVCVEDLVEQLKSECTVPKQKNIALLWTLPDALPSIVTDYEKLGHILKNLIDNAIKFTETGTVTISVALRNADCGWRMAKSKNEDIGLQSGNPSGKRETRILQSTIDLSVMTEASAIRIPQIETRVIEFSVQDTGIGIAAQTLPSIFDIFKQGDSSDTRGYEGAGLGLYIVKKYSDLLGANITVESIVGKGSTFTLALPLNGPRHLGGQPEAMDDSQSYCRR